MLPFTNTCWPTGRACRGTAATMPSCRRRRPPIIGLNGWIRDYAARSGSAYLDYYAALAQGRDFQQSLTVDGLLPNDAGYGVMAALAEKAIAAALAKP